MTKRTATIRLPEELAVWLTSEGEGINQAVISTVETLRRIRTVSMGELKGVFTSEEWKFIADSLNGTLVDATFRCNVSALIAHCEDAEAYEGTGGKWGVDLPLLCAKIKSLKGANIEALYSRVESFWKNSETTNLEEWAQY